MTSSPIQWSFLVPLIGGRYHIIPQLAVYTTYIPLIYCLLGDYISPIPPIKGTRNSYWPMFKFYLPFFFSSSFRCLQVFLDIVYRNREQSSVRMKHSEVGRKDSMTWGICSVLMFSGSWCWFGLFMIASFTSYNIEITKASFFSTLCYIWILPKWSNITENHQLKNVKFPSCSYHQIAR